MYNLFIERNVIKFLSKLEKKDSKRIFEKIKELKNNPVPQDAKRLVNVKDRVFRIRIGKFRVLYRLNGDKIIVVFLVDKRSRVY